MIEYKNRKGITQLAIVLGMLTGGCLFGVWLGKAACSDSDLCILISGAMLPASLFTGLALWYYTAVIFFSVQMLKRPKKNPTEKIPDGPIRDLKIPPGSIVLVPIPPLFALIASAAISSISPSATFLATGFMYFPAGLIYGILAWRLCRSGFIPIPDGS